MTEDALSELKRRRAAVLGGHVRRYAPHTSPFPRQSGVCSVFGGWTPVSVAKVCYGILKGRRLGLATNLRYIARLGSGTSGAPTGPKLVLQPGYSRENPDPVADHKG